MSEGPQVRLRAEWLHQQLAGVTVVAAQTTCDHLRGACAEMAGRLVDRVFCKGKHLFIAFKGSRFLHNHLLMHGRWRRLAGRFLFLPPEAWLGLDVGSHTICNYAGQVLDWMDDRAMRETVARLGPDMMAGETTDEIAAAALHASPLPIVEALLDQGVVSGLGNVARSEALFRANVAPGHRGCELTKDQMAAVLGAAREVLWDSYHHGGRWEHRVYQRTGEMCGRCHARICSSRLAPSQRPFFFCPECQT